MIRTLIVDDEAEARGYLRSLLADAHPEVEVVGEASNISEAQHLIAELKPALVFLDVEMPGGSGSGPSKTYFPLFTCTVSLL